MKPAVIAKNATDAKIKTTSPMVHHRLLVIIALVASEVLWSDEGVDEVDEDPEREQRSYHVIRTIPRFNSCWGHSLRKVRATR
jgi:hypothetical protein